MLNFFFVLIITKLSKNNIQTKFKTTECKSIIKTKSLRFYSGFINLINRSTLVEVNGIEPMTSCVQGRRSPS